MSNIKRNDAAPKPERDIKAELRDYQKSLARYVQKRIDGILYTRFEQYMIDCRILDIRQGERVILDTPSYHQFSDLEDRRISWEAWQNKQEGTQPKFDLTRPEGLVKRIT